MVADDSEFVEQKSCVVFRSRSIVEVGLWWLWRAIYAAAIGRIGSTQYYDVVRSTFDRHFGTSPDTAEISRLHKSFTCRWNLQRTKFETRGGQTLSVPIPSDNLMRETHWIMSWNLVPSLKR